MSFATKGTLVSLARAKVSKKGIEWTEKSPVGDYRIDGNKNGQTRKISTLSGGEKFMVSLAMALALAEMTRGAAKIDSFFIDEGFGSLDSDYLDEVLEVLNDVQARGKSITIITHIEDLYRRIPVNLHIKKEHNGESKIHIVHN